MFSLLTATMIYSALGLACLVLMAVLLRRMRSTSKVDSFPAPAVSVVCPGGGVFFWWQIGAIK